MGLRQGEEGVGRRWWIWAGLAAGLLLRLWFVRNYANVSADSLLYGDIAQNLLKHGRYGLSQVVNGVAGIRPTLIRLPGYPLFLAGCFAVFGVGRFSAVIGVQVALDLWTCLLLAGVARRLFGDRAGVAALWMGALCPFMANYAAAPLTETSTLFCMALAFYGLVRWTEDVGVNRWVWVIGFALAWGLLLRPEQGMLAVCVVAGMCWVVWKGKGNGVLVPDGHHFVGFWTLRVVPVLLVCLLTVAPLGPWAVRNWRVFHVIQPLAPRYANDPGERNPYGFQRWYRTWAIDFASTDQVYWNFESAPISIADLPNRAFDSNEQYAETEAALAMYDETTTSSPALDARFAALAKERVQVDPIRYYVALPVARMLNMAFRPRVDNLPVPLEWWKVRTYGVASLFAAAYALLNLGYFVMAGVALWRCRVGGVEVWVMVGTVVLRALLLLNLDNSEPRYTLEFYPVLIVLGAGVFSCWTVARRSLKGG